MQIGTKFSIGIHILLSVVVFKDRYKVTSDFLAASANTNPVIIRKIMGLLREAGLIEVASGTGGITLTKEPKEISLKDIYLAVNPIKNGKLFNIHKKSAAKCPVGGNIINLLDPYFTKAQDAMENNLSKSTLQNLLDDLNHWYIRGVRGDPRPLGTSPLSGDVAGRSPAEGAAEDRRAGARGRLPPFFPV
jgi:DNA-binding IscR family transcriptional regulator